MGVPTFTVRDKYTCSKCGKQTTIRWGWINHQTGEFFCNKCERSLKRSSEQQGFEDYMKSVLKGLPPPLSWEEEENRRMITMLKEEFPPSIQESRPPMYYYRPSGLYSLKELKTFYNRRFTHNAITEKAVSIILNRLGFTERRTMGQNYTFVWIDVNAVERLRLPTH